MNIEHRILKQGAVRAEGRASEPGVVCPRCGGESRPRGKAPYGRTYRKCVGCGRCFTSVYLHSAPLDTGPFPYDKTFYFGLREVRILREYGAAHNLTPVRAVRRLLREALTSPRGFVAARVPGEGQWSCGVGSLSNAEQAARVAEVGRRWAGLRDRRAETLQALRLRDADQRESPTVYVDQRVRVCLDAAAAAGLLYVMEREGLGHQDAARWIVRRAYVPRAWK